MEDNIQREIEEEEIRREVKKDAAFQRQKEEILDNAFVLFQYLEDNSTHELRKAILFFHEKYSFDIGELPIGLREGVLRQQKADDLESQAGYLTEEEDHLRAVLTKILER